MQLKKSRLSAFLAIIATLTPVLGSPVAAQGLVPNNFHQNHALSSRLIASEFESSQETAEPDLQLILQGDEHLDRQEYQAALESYRQALEIYQAQDPDSSEIALQGMAKAYLLMEDYPNAIAIFEKLVADSRQENSTVAPSPPLSNLGLAYFLAGEFKEAEVALKEAIAGWEETRRGENDPNKIEDDLNKITFLEQQAYSYRLLQKVLVAQNKPEEALLVAEQSRAVSLVEQFVENSGSSPIPPPTIERLQQIAQGTNSTIVEYSLVGSELRVFGNEPRDETDLYIWVVQPNGVISFRQVDLRQLPEKSLTELVTKVRTRGLGVRGRGIVLVEASDGTRIGNIGTSPQQLERLYQLLIAPIADLLPQNPRDRVTFVPQEALFLVPFAALTDPSGNHLIDKHTLLSAPSIQVLALTQEQKQRLQGSGNQNSLVVGNPTMPTLPAQGDDPPQPLMSLPGAEQEALAIASLLNTQPLIGNQATKAAVVNLMPQQRIIHLATHGLLDLDNNLEEFGPTANAKVPSARESRVFITPGTITVGSNVIIGEVPAEQVVVNEGVLRVSLPGAIALAPSDDDSGFLTATEILDLQLNNTELVVLSACDTGRGRITGEGVVGLSRAFIATGVPSVVVSLWVVPDAPTSTLMTEFYRQLQQTSDNAQALRQAMLTTKKQYPHPRNWAAFILIGEP
ncbi:MAG: CHAT domain-containing protein [Symploca sp. SIO2E6]|nr:CHAT domain-containing protein [Symploca sp. SIO2E6]